MTSEERVKAGSPSSATSASQTPAYPAGAGEAELTSPPEPESEEAGERGRLNLTDPKAIPQSEEPGSAGGST